MTDNNRPKMQLFLLHFGGGNCYSFQFLKKELERYFEFIPLELPGRGKRIQEPLIYNKYDAVRDYLSQIRKLRNSENYLIYGHSMGATLGHILTSELEKLNDSPKFLIVSGNSGSGRDVTRERYKMNDQDFKTELRKLGGVPDEVLENCDLFDFFSPIMRADFEILEKEGDIYETNIVLSTPIHAIMGEKEEGSNQIENWRKMTSADFEWEVLPGNHFFIYDQADRLIYILKNKNDRTLVY